MKKVFACLMMLCMLLSGGLFLTACSTNNADLVGRVLATRVEGKSDSVYVYFVDKDMAHFSSDVGNDVEYSRNGSKVVFKGVEYMDAYYNKLYARIYENSQYKDNETFQYFFMNFYADSNCINQVAYTYPDDTIVDKVNILKTFTAKEFEVVSHEPPSFMPDEHENPAELSAIDQKALALFKNVKTLTFKEDNSCVAVLNDYSILNGTFEQFRTGEISLNFGPDYVVGQKFVKMSVYIDCYPMPTPDYWGEEEVGTYDPTYSNLTPPPYFESEDVFIYWQGQHSRFVIR